MNRWFVAIVLAGACIAGARGLAGAQPVPTPSPMVSASATPVTTMQP